MTSVTLLPIHPPSFSFRPKRAALRLNDYPVQLKNGLIQIMPSVLPVIVLIELAFFGTFCAYAAVRFMHFPFTPGLAVLCSSIIGGVYLLNRATDAREDFVNNSGRAFLLLYKRGLLALGVIFLSASTLYIAITGRLTVFYVVLVLSGIFYSIPLIPGARRRSYRLKDIPFIKNAVVAFVWGSSAFIVPITYYHLPMAINGIICVLICAFTISTFSNTLFNDIRDIDGDRLAGARTLPVLFGRRVSYVIIGLIDLLWLGTLILLRVESIVPSQLFPSLVILSVFPCLYIVPYRFKLISSPVAEAVAELHLVAFSLCLLLSV